MKNTLKTVVAGSLVAAGLACAQTGLAGGSEGLHQMNANTLGQWGVTFGAGGDLSFDSWALASGGYIYDKTAKQGLSLNESAISISGNANAAIGLTNWMDVGVNLPIYFDMGTDNKNRIGDNGMTDVAIGDIEAWLKLNLVGRNEGFFRMALMANVYFPTGSDEAGFRPRHSWYLSDYTTPYTLGDYAAGGSLIFSFNGRKVHWNTQIGYVQPFDTDNYSGAITYSTGFNYLPAKFIDLFLEFSGEAHINDMRAPIDPTVDPMIITPGFRLHLSDNIDLAMGVDVGARIFKNLEMDGEKDREEKNGFEINVKDKKGTLTYGYSSSPLLAATAAVTWNFGGYNNKAEEEKARVKELIEKRAQEKLDSAMATVKPDTLTLTKVDSIVVTDTIAKLDTLKTIDTVKTVDTVTVKDLVADSLNKAKMDSVAAVNDSLAKLSADADGDGVPNMVDRCPDTPAGIKVGADGCEVDTDNDGVVDSKDACPASNPGAPVDEKGCEIDEDMDGVVDVLDKCPVTLSEVEVDAEGCPTNKDEDLTKLQAQIKFAKGKAKLTKPTMKVLDKVVALKMSRKDLRIEVQAHTDEMGVDAEDNQELSEKRAKAIMDYMVKKGVPSKHVRAVGLGDTQLVVPVKAPKKGKKFKANPKNTRVVLAPHVKKPKAEKPAEAAPAAEAPAAAPAAAPAPAEAPAAAK
ncbi:OmpA family protein [Fibrobacter sp. UWEL]|uniref:OmpA family protein n=1 Tax=Fibrobacter sp. UWEL TaxID=1896209 RepID=UPI0009206BBD|nr:OmpA family protein [Fibrobacter sp. UWEL]SHK64393.1 Thrombospondin type 3 repeat-containing protein [Fibrobacter sp. UWEL]